jgi:Tol biopolymer transport system component
MKKLRMLILPVLLCAMSFAQEATIKPNDALILANIPPIPASIADKAGKYTDYRTAALYGWHPQKREILIGTRFADTVQVHEVAMPGGARTQMTFFGDRVSDASYQPHKGDYFLFRKDVGGGEWYQIFRFDLATGDVTMLTDGKSRSTEFVWSNKGDRVAYAGTLRNNADLDFYVIDPAAKPEARKPLTENQGGGWEVRDWSPDDRTLLAVEGISVNESHVWLVDVDTGAKKMLTPARGDKVAYEPIGFSRDGKGVYVRTDKNNEFLRLAYKKLAQAVISPFAEM